MKKTGQLYIFVILGLLFTGILLILSLFWIAPSQNLLGASSDRTQTDDVPAMASVTTDNIPTSELPSDFRSDELPPVDFITNMDSVSAFPTPIPGETLLYFVPTDNDATATVLFLYNTDSSTQTVALRGFSYNGVLVYSLNITIGPNSFLRLASDSIASAPPPSWATPAPIITNFTDFTYVASLSLPRGVKVEGYVLFNPGTGVVDPRKDQGAIPLRFSTDPATLFLPTIQNNP
jgi:hypothetical protein